MTGEWGTGVLGDIADLVMGQSPDGGTCNDVGKGVPLLNGPTDFGGSGECQGSCRMKRHAAMSTSGTATTRAGLSATVVTKSP